MAIPLEWKQKQVTAEMSLLKHELKDKRGTGFCNSPHLTPE